MSKKQKTKKTKNLNKFSIFMRAIYIVVGSFIIATGVMGYMSWKTNQELRILINNIEQEKETQAGKAETLQSRLTELDAQIMEQGSQPPTEEADPSQNVVAVPEPTEIPAPTPTEVPLPTPTEEPRPEIMLASLQVGQIVDRQDIEGRTEQFFAAYEIQEGDAVFNRINGRSYYPNENIGLDQLRYLKVLHYNFNHQIQVGEIIVNAAIAEDVLNVFKELFAIEYEVEKMQLIDDYWTGDGGSSDTNSIEYNNTSAFCYRTVTGGGNLSNHAYGRAIDINPQQNPYVWYEGDELRWSHSNASPYIDRYSGNPHVIVENDACYNIFTKYGFSWGGLWGNPIDYQHFEKKF